jgi:hypothetical protein
MVIYGATSNQLQRLWIQRTVPSSLPSHTGVLNSRLAG